MKKFLLFLNASIFISILNAQVTSLISYSNKNTEKITETIFSTLNAKHILKYDFETEQGTYYSISKTGTALTPNDWDDGYVFLDLSDIFSFFYDGKYYNTMSISTNGGLIIGSPVLTFGTP